mgnify:CR=1 FL=1
MRRIVVIYFSSIECDWEHICNLMGGGIGGMVEIVVFEVLAALRFESDSRMFARWERDGLFW